MWLDLFKACVALTWMYLIVYFMRQKLAVMSPADAATAKRKFLVGMLAAAALIGALTLVLLRVSP